MISLYKPNARLTGSAGSFRYSPEKDCVFAQLIKQSTWDAANHIGGFKESMNDPKKKVTVALGFVELGAIVDCIERNRPFEVFHEDGKNTGGKSVSFKPWMSKDATPVLKGYSFSVTVNDKEDINNKVAFYIGISFSEARYLKEFLLYAMYQHFKNDAAKQAVKNFNPIPHPGLKPVEVGRDVSLRTKETEPLKVTEVPYVEVVDSLVDL